MSGERQTLIEASEDEHEIKDRWVSRACADHASPVTMPRCA